MGLNIEIKNALFSKKATSLLPFSDNLAGYWLFDQDLTEGIKNKITGVSGTVIGSPTVADGKLITSNTNGFLTDISMPGEKTLISISKRALSFPSHLIGTLDNANAGALGIQVTFVTNIPYIQLNGQNLPPGTSGSSANLIHFIAGAVGTNSNSLYLSKGGVLFETTAAHAQNLSDLQKFRIGGCGGTSLTGTTETYAALIYDRKLSNAEVQTVFDFFKAKLTNIVID